MSLVSNYSIDRRRLCSPVDWLARVALLLWLASPAHAAACRPDSLFSAPDEPAVQGPQRSVHSGDLNRDGVPDLVFSMGRAIEVHLGSIVAGHYQMQPGNTYGTNFDPQGVAIADFDGDSTADLAVVCDAGGLYVFKGAGDGTFTTMGRYNFGSLWEVAAADVDDDGVLDLVTTARNGSLLVFLGSGVAGAPDGRFQFPVEYASIGSPKGLLLRDLNGDGALDAVVATQQSFLAIHLGIPGASSATGRFTRPIPVPLPNSESYDVVAADFDGDGRLDLACTDYSSASVTVCLQTAPLVFSLPVRHPLGGSPYGLLALDVNHDGTPDLVAGNGTLTPCLVLMLNQGAGSASLDRLGPATRVGPNRAVSALLGVDLDADRVPDVVASTFTTSSPLFFTNQCPLDRFTLEVSAGAGGSVDVTPDRLAYAPGDTVTLTASARPTFRFGGWRGDATGSARTIRVVMDGPRFVTAEFPPVTHDLTTTLTGLGGIRRTPDTGVFHEGSAAGLRALPAIGFHFTGWSGDATSANDSLVLIMDRDHAVTAAFEPDSAVAPHILSVKDVPNDQGGFVKLRWSSSLFEFVPQDSGVAVNRYWIWRELPEGVTSARTPSESVGPSVHFTRAAGRTFAWEFVTSVSVGGFEQYSLAVRTGGDSISAGNPYTRFLVQARDVGGTRYWDSAPDSGYSIDNLGPQAPRAFTATFLPSGVQLLWSRPLDADVAGYRLHRGSTADFEPGPANEIASTVDTTYRDAVTSEAYYKVVAIDRHGNPGPAASALAIGELLSLAGAQPNPSGATRCVVHFTLPDARPARLMLLDLNGRRLRSLRVEHSGTQSVDLAMGRRLAPGLYWIRLEHPSGIRSQRVVVME